MIRFAEVFLIYIAVPFVLFFAITMSFLMQDLLALIISTIGTMSIMFIMGKVHGK